MTVKLQDWTQWNGLLGTAIAVARVGLGVVLIVGGWKLAFPADPAGLVQSYTDPAAGWIAPFFVDWIAGSLPVDVLGFLQALGWLEMIVGFCLAVGLATPWIAALAGAMFLSFPMANPVAGMVRLAQDASMGGFALAIAFTGSGRWSVDQRLGWFPESQPGLRNWFLGLIRVSLLYAFVMALMFPFDVGTNPLNQTLPRGVVLLLAAALLPTKTARVSCGIIAVWMFVLILVSVTQAVMDQGIAGLYWGLDSAKRQLGLCGASLGYVLAGPDTVSLIPPGELKSTQEPTQEVNRS
jgi:uncharacterized membrane protein YphA (DoxX/SURF4 family)